MRLSAAGEIFYDRNTYLYPLFYFCSLYTGIILHHSSSLQYLDIHNSLTNILFVTFILNTLVSFSDIFSSMNLQNYVLSIQARECKRKMFCASSSFIKQPMKSGPFPTQCALLEPGYKQLIKLWIQVTSEVYLHLYMTS